MYFQTKIKRNFEIRLKEHPRYVNTQEISKSSIVKHEIPDIVLTFKIINIIFNAIPEWDFLENLAFYLNH